MDQTSRRNLLKGISAFSLTGVSASLIGFRSRVDAGETPSSHKPNNPVGYGPIAPVKDETTGLPLLKLPAGFKYHSLGWRGEELSDGVITPALHDGMTVLKADANEIVLCRNHEIDGSTKSMLPADQSYDSKSGGGCINLILDPNTMKVKKGFSSLSGTSRNCAGGITPWGTWLSCEECVYEDGEKVKNNKIWNFDKTHGWVFEVPVEGTKNPKPITGMGRFWHEALAFDKETGNAYLTEDRDTAGFYRFTPKTKGVMLDGGKLQMMKLDSIKNVVRDVPPGSVYDVSWVDIEDVTQAHAPETRNTLGVYRQGVNNGGCTFSRLEGCIEAEGYIYFTATNGGNAKCGQVWEYSPKKEKLRLVYESPNKLDMNFPDNLTVSPRGGILICEDGYQQGPDMRLTGVTTDGLIYPFAQNNVQLNKEYGNFVGDYRKTEFAGSCFTPDGKWLFVNIQSPGITFAITGPWQKGLV